MSFTQSDKCSETTKHEKQCSHSNIIVMDPRGELFKKTAVAARLSGYQARILNLAGGVNRG